MMNVKGMLRGVLVLMPLLSIACAAEEETAPVEPATATPVLEREPPRTRPAQALRGRGCSIVEPSDAEKGVIERSFPAVTGQGLAATSFADINVHVHVISMGPGPDYGDVADTQIASQIAVLNTAYASAGFRFVLASIDRTVDTAWFDMTQGSTAERDAKAALRVNGKNRLNLYITGAAVGGTLGWGSFPWSYAAAPGNDGVVVDFGTLPGGYYAPFNEGDTATHEIGHWLGLYHTFQGGCSSSNDLVSDTPATASPTLGCAVGRDSCVGTAFPGLDPVTNFMDYTDDACMDRFSPGQGSRMRSAWAAFRRVL
jgi:Pregnancy-associated plasma protein-A